MCLPNFSRRTCSISYSVALASSKRSVWGISFPVSEYRSLTFTRKGPSGNGEGLVVLDILDTQFRRM